MGGSQQELLDLLTAAIERQPVGVFIVRFDGGNPLRPPIVYANEAFCALTGYTKDEIASGTYPVIVGPLTDRELVASQAHLVAGGQNVVTELMLYHRDGTPFFAEVRAHPIDVPVRHGVLIVEDISERRGKDRAFAMINEAIEQASDFVIVTDSQTHAQGGPRIVYANRSFFEATGFAPEDILGKPYTTIYSKNNDPNLMAAIREAIDAGKPNYREMLAARKDGSDFWIEFVAKPFTVEDATFRMSIGRDITTRKRSFNQIALLFSAFEQSTNRVTLYEPNDAGDLAPSYENDPAIAAGSHRLLDLWNGQTESARVFRERLLGGDSVLKIYSEVDAAGVPAVVELVARGVRNGNDLGAVLTIERILARASATDGYSSRLITFARLLPALAEAESTTERFSVLRALLLDTFVAELEEAPRNSGTGVHIAPGSNAAHFTFAGTSYIARWPKPLQQSSLTALRFCIEAAIEQENVASR